MALGLSKSVESFIQGREARKRQGQGQIDDVIKMAQLKELGYDYNPSTRALIQRPDYVSTKDLERQKLQNELDPDFEANRAARKERAIINARREAMFGQQGGSQGESQDDSFGGMGLGTFGGKPDTESPFVYDPISGTQKPNPSYLNPLEKEKLASLEAKKQDAAEAQRNKEEMIRQDAEAQLSAIQQAKKGKKYFGMMGNLPTWAAPSTITSFGGEYGQRKEWENNINRLLSGKVIDLMNKMKSASRTGATGFGQLNKSELQLLKDASTVLSKDLPGDIAMKYLNDMERIYQKMLNPSNNQTFGQSGEPDPSSDPLEAEAQAAIASGADPKAVMARLSQLRSRRN